ncbi:riboflavin biosynthesis protein RibD, partial [Streptococcus pneumoniae]
MYALSSLLFKVYFFGGSEMSDSKYMKLAIKLAQKGAGYVNPNPMV